MHRFISIISWLLIAGMTYCYTLPPAHSRVGKPGLNLGSVIHDPVIQDAAQAILQGRKAFRLDTFGDEAFWGGQLQLHQTIKGEAFGGIGPGLSPATALSLGLKVDVEALPQPLVVRLRKGRVDLNNPAVTLELLRLNAILGVTGFFDAQNNLTSVGIQCALCHSVVDNSLAEGIGRRLDGWANRDLNVGAIIAFAPNMQPFIDLLQVVIPGVDADAVRDVFNGWGPGKFDAELILDGKIQNPFTGGPSATLIPPAFGLAGINLHTWTGWGSVPHWNAFVANLEMGGLGVFFDPRLREQENGSFRFPIAAAFNFDNVRDTPDRITPKLADLHMYQLALKSPAPPPGSFNTAAATQGEGLFNGKARCFNCHVPPLFTEPGWNLHTPAEIGIDPFQADRSPDRRYRTAPLKGLWTHTKGGFYHDGRFASLEDVVNHYNTTFSLGLTAEEINALVQYLLSL